LPRHQFEVYLDRVFFWSLLALVAAMACFGYFKGLYDANILCWALLACASRMQLRE
jgi:hypothetical protein